MVFNISLLTLTHCLLKRFGSLIKTTLKVDLAREYINARNGHVSVNFQLMLYDKLCNFDGIAPWVYFNVHSIRLPNIVSLGAMS